MEEGESGARPPAFKAVSSLNLSVPPVPLWNSNTGPVCSPNTINKVSAAHQYCYLHRVLI